MSTNTAEETKKEETKSNSNPKKRVFILDDKVSEKSSREIVLNIIEINEHDAEQKSKDENYVVKPIIIITNTYGGSLYEANAIVGAIEISQTPVHTHCYGKTMSAGFYIFSSGHHRVATPLATFMYHDASVGMHDTIQGLKTDLNHFEKLRDAYDEYMLSVTNLPKSIMDEKKRIKEDWYLTAQQAFEFGLVDEIIPFRKRGK